MRKLIVRPPGREDRLEKQWKWNPQRRAVENHTLGVAFQIVDVVYEDTNETHHEGFVVLSRRTEMHVVVRNDGHIGLVFHRREKMIPPRAAEKFFKKNPHLAPDISLIKGVEQFECPHGIAIQKLAEAKEETGYEVAEAIPIGFIKESPSWGGIAHALYATRLSDKRSVAATREDGEQIINLTFFPPKEIRNVLTICGLTQAALWRFRCWGLTQSTKTLWRKVAVRL